jgi:hypothetical protein
VAPKLLVVMSSTVLPLGVPKLLNFALARDDSAAAHAYVGQFLSITAASFFGASGHPYCYSLLSSAFVVVVTASLASSQCRSQFGVYICKVSCG